jgi:hypothetical protein
MNATSAAITAALTFTWLGMVLAISFLEAPLKFRAPGVTIPIGLGIGRLVFRALNAVEAGLAVAVAGRRRDRGRLSGIGPRADGGDRRAARGATRGDPPLAEPPHQSGA